MEETITISSWMLRGRIFAGYLFLIAVFVLIQISFHLSGFIQYMLFGVGFGIFNAFNFSRQAAFSTVLGIASIIAEADIAHIIERARWIALQAAAGESSGRRQEGGQFILLGIFAGEFIFLLVSLIGSRIFKLKKAPPKASENQKKAGELVIILSSYILLLAIYIPVHLLWANALDDTTGYILFGILVAILGVLLSDRKKIFFVVLPAIIALIEGMLAGEWTNMVMGPWYGQIEKEGGYVEFDPRFPRNSALLAAGIAIGLSLVFFLAAKLIESSRDQNSNLND